MTRFRFTTCLSKRNLILLHNLSSALIFQFSSPLIVLSFREITENVRMDRSSEVSTSSHQASSPHLEGEKTLEINVHGTGARSSGPERETCKNESSHTKEFFIAEILSRDKEIFELKRQHELSMLRVEHHQRRLLKDQEDRGMYYEQNCNVHTFDTVSVGLHSQRTTLYHTMSLERLRNFKIVLTIIISILCCWYIYYRYMINPEFTYIKKPMKVLGSRVQAIRDMNWDRMTEEEKLNALSVRGPQ